MSDEDKARQEVMIEIMGHRDILLQTAQRFLNSLYDDDVGSFTLEQQAHLMDLAMYAGCTNLKWWKPSVSEMNERPIIG